MKSEEKRLARKSIDKKLNALRDVDAFAKPARGWLKAIRESLGMTTAQFGKRLGVSQPRALEIEKSEVKGTLTLDSLERAAHALNCRLVYTIMPNEPLEDMIEARAQSLAMQRMKHTAHSMQLEDQAVSKTVEKAALQKLVRQLSNKSGSELWEEQ